MKNEYPKIRHLGNFDQILVAVDNRQMIALRDRLNLNGKEELVIMPPEFFSVMINLFNGTNSLSDIQTALTRINGGVLFPRSILIDIIETLDQNIMLENTTYHQAIAQFHDLPKRTCLLAGHSFPRDPQQLGAMLDEIMQKSQIKSRERLQGLIAPHIDLNRGELCYADAYQAAKTNPDGQIYVILGTTHSPVSNRRFVFSNKPYETPYGQLSLHREFIDKVAARYSNDIFADQIVHKGEHCIEFQALFLQHTFPSSSITVVPILVGSFHDLLEQRKSPAEDIEISEMLAILKEVAAEIGEEKICWIASVDLAHVGQRFGDSMPLDESLLAKIREFDMQLLNHAEAKNPEGFFQTIAEQADQYKICGLSPIYCLLDILNTGNTQGNLLRYEQSLEPEAQSVVTFATMIFPVRPSCIDASSPQS